MSMIMRAASALWRLLSIDLAPMVRKPRDFVVIKRRYCVLGYSTICLATLTKLKAASWSMFWSEACLGLCDTVFDVRVVRGVHLCASILSGCECQKTIFRSTEKLLRMKRSMNVLPSRIFIARWGATPIRIRVLCSPWSRWIEPVIY